MVTMTEEEKTRLEQLLAQGDADEEEGDSEVTEVRMGHH